MNENLNLVEILKDCPRGTKLYSTVYGDVELIKVCQHSNNSDYPIEIRLSNNSTEDLTMDGRLYEEFDGECTLFPSKDQRDWSKFNPKKEELAPPCKFKVGDWVVFNGFTLYIKEVVKGFYRTISKGGISNSYDWDIDNIARLWVIQDAKDGDVLANDHHILILKELVYDWSSSGTPYSVKAYCGIKPNGNFEIGKDNWCFCGTLHIHPATKEQRDALMKAMNDAGYVWDEKKKELRELIKPKFDPKTLQPFDKVLARIDGGNSYCWFADFVSTPAVEKYDTVSCIMSNEDAEMIIPYNEETKHLVGTNEEAPEYYRYWE